MKVGCKFCRKLVDEADAVRMTVADYKEWLHFGGENTNYGFYTTEPFDYQIYTQICQDCYKKKYPQEG